MKTVIFDLDGTLADTSADLIAAANHVFEMQGITPPLDATADALTAFRGGRAMLRLGWSRIDGWEDEARVDAGYQPLLEFYGNNIVQHTQLYPGVGACLATLAAEDWALGVCTNKPEGLARQLLDELELTNSFGALFGADTLSVRKPHPLHFTETLAALGGSLDQTLLIGDTETDAKTARAAGVPLVLVAFGPEGEGIARLNPNALLHSYADLPKIAAGLIKTQGKRA